jgi:DMSO/TMAO reductase YedYZ molybdopterin-dependent catalytic subunit
MSGLEFLTERPPNAGVPLSRLDGRPVSQERAYLRNSFDAPPAETLTGEIEVAIPGRPTRTVNTDDLIGLGPVEIDFVLECAGNGRSLVRPVVDGLAWGLGGVSPVRVAGVRLIDMLGQLPDQVMELVITGADRGTVHPEGEVNYQFSVVTGRVADGSALLVTEWGGEPLGVEHGGPIRFMLPGDYAMRSVKWVTRIEGVTRPFAGHFVDRYRYLGDDRHDEGSPVGAIHIRSVIATPAEGTLVGAGRVLVSGSAWSGVGPVVDVSVSTDHGETWLPAELDPGPGPWSACAWRCEVELSPGQHTVLARATDAGGNTQPVEPPWNARGYANNVVHRVSFETAQP